ncbi:DUF2190 family protein [Paraburkholderia pallida]|uniref:DUF2190 family protein n=1 Tax=Paraburkholderia pallida TaxID=2547399 RepID=A0A4P7CVH2_9BURK|nr:DUF2190 family protein [Paraburkholderia pallida]QBQ98174.1 DUF2190 family protein [Paraburkholderia pallida]
MQNFIQKGSTLTFTLATAVASGQLVMVGALPCVAQGPYPANVEGEYRCVGVYEFPAAAADTAKAGAAAYFDGEKIVVEGDVCVGIYVADKAVNSSVARVRLNGVAMPPVAAG